MLGAQACGGKRRDFRRGRVSEGHPPWCDRVRQGLRACAPRLAQERGRLVARSRGEERSCREIWSGRRESILDTQLGKLRRRAQVADIARKLLYKVSQNF